MSVEVTVDEFTTRFTAFEDRDEDLIAAMIAEAALECESITNETKQRLAILYLTAHLFATEDTATGTQIISESVGPLSTTYATPKEVTANNYATTEYGRRFLRLRGSAVGTGVMVVF